jgi:hypothetical protein
MGVSIEVADDEGRDSGVKGGGKKVGQTMAKDHDIMVDGKGIEGGAIGGGEFHQ